jgi:hypothetical protein
MNRHNQLITDYQKVLPPLAPIHVSPEGQKTASSLPLFLDTEVCRTSPPPFETKEMNSK